MFVQASSGTSLSTNLSRGDAFALGNHSASNYTVYFVHVTNYFDSSTIPLHQPFSGESSSKVSIQKVAVGGSPIPSVFDILAEVGFPTELKTEDDLYIMEQEIAPH